MNIEFLKNFTWTPANVAKVAGLGLGALVVVAVGLSVANSIFQGVPRIGSIADMDMVAPSYAPQYYKEEMAYEGGYGIGGGGVALSTRNAASSISYPYPQPGGTTGDTAEEFEVTQYNASFESRDKSSECGAIAGLKAKDYVVFENANEGDRDCSYTFKVKHDKVDEVLAFIKDMGPRDLSENTYTIKNQIDDFTSETDILKKKLTSIDETLAGALKAYDDIQRLATANQNADALAKVIDSKILLIERLTQERININEQLDRYARMKSEQLDRLDYTYFYVSVYEMKYVDGERIWDSWKQAVSATVNDVNENLQAITLGLVALLFIAIQYILYILILVVIAKYVWRAAVYIWNK